MTTKPTQLRRVLAMRLHGERAWTAKATDGRHVGRGLGTSWREAVSEAVREIDEKARAA